MMRNLPMNCVGTSRPVCAGQRWKNWGRGERHAGSRNLATSTGATTEPLSPAEITVFVTIGQADDPAQVSPRSRTPTDSSILVLPAAAEPPAHPPFDRSTGDRSAPIIQSPVWRRSRAGAPGGRRAHSSTSARPLGPEPDPGRPGL